jgi:hypothetical protein
MLQCKRIGAEETIIVRDLVTFPMSPKTMTRCSEFCPGDGGARNV